MPSLVVKRRAAWVKFEGVDTKADRFLLVLKARAVRVWKQTLLLVQPETLLRWHREAFRLFWKHKSKAHVTKTRISSKTIALIKEMAEKNRLWGAEGIRGELRKLGIQVCKRTVQKYMRWLIFVYKYGKHGLADW